MTREPHGQDDMTNRNNDPRHTRERNNAMDSQNQGKCGRCGCSYTPTESRDTEYWGAPYCYGVGCRDYCLACWLDVGPLDTGEVDRFADPMPRT